MVDFGKIYTSCNSCNRYVSQIIALQDLESEYNGDDGNFLSFHSKNFSYVQTSTKAKTRWENFGCKKKMYSRS